MSFNKGNTKNKCFTGVNLRVLSLLIVLINLGCVQTKEQQNTHTLSKQLKAIKLPPKHKQLTYAIHVNTKTPFEMYIDDILLSSYPESGLSSTIELNQYLLKNGTHTLKVRYLPRTDTEDGLLYPEHVVFSKYSKWNIFFVSYIKNLDEALGYEGEIDYVKSELKVIPPPEPVPFWEQTFELEINNLPYDIEGWSNGKDLTKIDEEVLEKKVVAFYNKLRDLLNEGKASEYILLGEQKDKEIVQATYDDDIDWYTSIERIESLNEKCQGNMLPIENYQMKFAANGRLVYLEGLNSYYTLIADTPEGKKYYSFYLFIPNGLDELKIIRK